MVQTLQTIREGLMKFTKKKTSRGFIYYEFKDTYDEDCSIQESSSIDPHLWLGQDNGGKLHHVTLEPLGARMHVDKKIAKKLIKLLTKFVETGRL